MVNRFNWTSCEIMLTKHIYLIPGHTENIFGKHHFYLSPIKDKQTISKDLDFGKIVKRRININYKIINIAFELCLLRTSAFGHLSTWLGPRSWKFLPPILLIFPLPEEHFPFSEENWKQGRAIQGSAHAKHDGQEDTGHRRGQNGKTVRISLKYSHKTYLGTQK